MNKDNHIKNNESEFDKLLRDKLTNHQTSVDPKIWRDLEIKLEQKNRRRKLVPWYYISGAVAACIALVLLLYPISKQNYILNEPTGKNIAKITEETNYKTDQKNDFQTKNDKKIIVSENHINNKKITLGKKQKVNQPTKIKVRNQHAENNLERPIVLDNKKNKEESKEEEVPKKQRSQNTKINSSDKKNNENIELPDLNDYADYKPVYTKKKTKPILTAYAGSNGNFNEVNSSKPISIANSSMAAPSFMVNKKIAEEYPTSTMRPEDYDEVEHLLPLSIGVKLELPLNKRIGIETGLRYTYLKTYFSKTGTVNYSGVLQLHYLGIPLNLRAKLFTGDKWNIYTSMGGMVEKGLRSKYHEMMESPIRSKHTDVSASIDGLQWSLHGGLGIDVSINRAISLFIEPDITYYLDNNQPMSARTNQPINLGLNGGLRFKL